MAKVTWSLRSTTPTTVMSTDLNSLANDAQVLSSVISNETDADTHGDFELVASFAVAPAANEVIELWSARTADGTNYEDGSSTVQPQDLLGTFVVLNSTSLRRIIPSVELPPRDFKVVLVNRSGQALAASGTTLKLLKYSRQVA